MEDVPHLSGDALQQRAGRRCSDGETALLLTDRCSMPPAISPYVTQLPNLALQQKYFLAGFRDCRQEVLRYLVDIEQLSTEKSIAFGLEQHLIHLEDILQSSYKCSDVAWESVQEFHAEHRQNLDFLRTDVSKVGSEQVGTSTEENETAAKPCFHETNSNKSSSPLLTELSVRTAESIARSSETPDSSFDSGCDSSLIGCLSSTDCGLATDFGETTPASGANYRRAQDVQTTDSRETVTESELAENACELMRLAQNNPSISRVLGELFDLMDDDYDVLNDEITDDDDDDYEDDGVEMDNDNNYFSSDTLDNC